MTINKLFWAARGFCYKASFGKFGNYSYIGKPTSLLGTKEIFVEDRVRIQPGIRMETASNGSIVIHENTSIGQNVHITADGEPLEIGKNTTILGNTFITNLDHDYREIGVHIMDQKRIVHTTKIGENCFIGFGACIQAGTVLGKQCVVGANAVVRGHFPDYSVIVGVPARVVKRYNLETKQWEKVDK
jgi:acetyltransferase-like isoleucine patch superfamily enzyme